MEVHCWFISSVVLNRNNPQMPFRKAITQPVVSYLIPQNYYTPGVECGTAACWTSWGFCQVSVPGAVNWNFRHWMQARVEMDVHFPLTRQTSTYLPACWSSQYFLSFQIRILWEEMFQALINSIICIPWTDVYYTVLPCPHS